MSSICKVSRRFGVLQSYGCPQAPQAPHHQPLMRFFFRFSPWLLDTHHKKPSTGNTLQCSQTLVEMVAPLPSVFSHDMSEEVRGPPHGTLDEDISRLLVFPHSVHCGGFSSSKPFSLNTFRHPFRGIIRNFRNPLGHFNCPSLRVECGCPHYRCHFSRTKPRAAGLIHSSLTTGRLSLGTQVISISPFVLVRKKACCGHLESSNKLAIGPFCRSP